MVHGLWLIWVFLMGIVSLMLIRCVGGGVGKRFVRNFSLRLGVRLFVMMWSLTDTYQDATFPVIAKRCNFDFYFVSTWLVVLGIIVLQFGAQVVAGIQCVYEYQTAKTPEGRSRQAAQGAFLLLRGSDNLVLVYAMRPAVEEQLGGSSSWAMKTTEARFAFFRFIFEDVEQGALQVVFLVFYANANAFDRIWMSASVATSLLFSFTLVVQCLPEVRDWLWHRLVPRLPCGRVQLMRLPWIIFLLVLHRYISVFPWVHSCSTANDACDAVAIAGSKHQPGWFAFCTTSAIISPSLRAERGVHNDTAWAFIICIAGSLAAMCLAAMW